MKIEIKGVIVPNDDKWVYDWLEMDSVCPREVLKLIDGAGGQELDVYINSGGGDIFAAGEIYAALRAYGGPVRLHVVGLAASAASVIACAGESDISPAGMVMVHNVAGRAQGDWHAMDKSSQTLQKANETIAAAYMDKTGMSLSKALELMDRETWLTAEDAVSLGLIDKIAGPKNLRLTAAGPCAMLPPSIVEKIRNMAKAPGEGPEILASRKAQAQLNLIKIGGIRE